MKIKTDKVKESYFTSKFGTQFEVQEHSLPSSSSQTNPNFLHAKILLNPLQSAKRLHHISVISRASSGQIITACIL